MKEQFTQQTAKYQAEFTKEELAEALLAYAKNRKLMTDVVNHIIESRKGKTDLKAYSATYQSTATGFKIEAELATNAGDLIRETAPEVKPERKVREGKSFKKKNIGFASTFTLFLEKKRKEKRKTIPFNEVLDFIEQEFGADFGRKRAWIYLSDKNLQKSRRFEFDGSNGGTIKL